MSASEASSARSRLYGPAAAIGTAGGVVDIARRQQPHPRPPLVISPSVDFCCLAAAGADDLHAPFAPDMSAVACHRADEPGQCFEDGDPDALPALAVEAVVDRCVETVLGRGVKSLLAMSKMPLITR